MDKPDLVGLPSVYFSDEEMLGSRVRLLRAWDLENGHVLFKGETFVVIGVRPGNRHTREFMLRNHRATGIPVKGHVCELVLQWPSSQVRGENHGGK